MRNKRKNKSLKGNLLLIGFLFIFLSYFDLNTDKENVNLIASRLDTIYTNVNANELMSILDNKTGVVLIVDDKKDINEYINILIDLKENENLYVYNSYKDELVLSYENNKINVIKEASNDYKKLINKLGAYINKYYIEYNDELIESDYYKINTPTVLFIKNGKIMFSFNNVEETTNEELIDTYKKGFNTIRY